MPNPHFHVDLDFKDRRTEDRPMIDVQNYWLDPPPEPSPGLTKWLGKIKAGWRPNKRIGKMGYFESSEYYKIYIWEYINVLWPTIEHMIKVDRYNHLTATWDVWTRTEYEEANKLKLEIEQWTSTPK